MTVPDMGWAGKENGELLGLASGRFEVFLTVDSHLASQQNVISLSFGIIVLVARSNRMEDLRPLMSRVREQISTMPSGRLVRIESH